MKDIKSALKDAREAIKNKQFETALKLCKQILKEENNNYMALIFLGVSLQETGQLAKALNAFQDAIKANSTNSLVWNGLINYYEKVDTRETKVDLIKAYISLLNLESNEKKIVECTQKLCSLHEYGNVDEIVSTVFSLLKSEKFPKNAELASSLIDILSQNTNLSSDLTLVYKECLGIVLNNQKTICIKYYADYLNLLYKLDEKKEVYKHAKKMHSIFESNPISVKWVCKIFNECYIEEEVIIEEEENITTYSDTLLNLEPQSPTALFTKSILLIVHKNTSQAKKLLDQVINILPGFLYAWILLLKCCVKLHLVTEAIQVTNKIDKLLQSNIDGKQKLKRIYILMLDVLSKSEDKQDLRRALQLYESMDDELKDLCKIHLIRTNINLEDFTRSEILLEELQKSSIDNVTYKLITAYLYYKQGKFVEALVLLENKSVELSEWWLQIGMLYCKIGQYEKSLMPFLKATKLEDTNFQCFLLLGNYYKTVNDINKARRCYEKCFKLNKQCSEACIELSKIYRRTKNWDANLSLLQTLTTGIINKKNSWAWLQLGLHYLEQQNYNEAITNLRLVIRVDDSNKNCWESLADAYLAKGAYTSALKCYEKVSSCSKNIFYPLLQMATIKKILGDLSEARSDFELIISSNDLYVPALKGMAETCLLQAKQCIRDQRLGTARDHVQCAVDHLIVALQQCNNLTCLWKLLGDGCVLVRHLPKGCSSLSLPSFMVESESHDGNVIVNKNELLIFAAKCYYKGISLIEDNIPIWHDLATCYLVHARKTKDMEERKEFIKKAHTIAIYCTSKTPNYWPYWNLLGNVALQSSPPDYRFAQHCFIKAVMADKNSAVAWCNLGILYFLLGENKLANEAYSQAQKADPNYLNSWVGQAVIAEGLAHEDAMDLFRHSTQLGFHKQGALGYAYWVCKTLKNSPPNVVIYSIHNMHAVPVAHDVMTWYTEYYPLEGTAWNMLGILKERMGLKLGAVEAFKKSLELSSPNYEDLVRVNYGRSLASIDKYSEAVVTFSKIKVASFNSGSELALALFKVKNYKESYETYESTLHWLSEEPDYQSELLVALASMAYMFEGPDAAKTLLFQSIQLEKPSPWGYYASLALSLLHDDINLSELILNELRIFKNNEECAQHLAVLSSYFHLLNKNGQASIREVSRIIHRYPDQANIWLTLSSLLIRLQKQKVAANCAQIAIKLGQSNMDITKGFCIVALSFFIIGETQEALWMAQKAVHYYPHLIEGWAILIATLRNTKKLSGCYLKNISQFVKTLEYRDEIIKWIQRINCNF